MVYLQFDRHPHRKKITGKITLIGYFDQEKVRLKCLKEC